MVLPLTVLLHTAHRHMLCCGARCCKLSRNISYCLSMCLTNTSIKVYTWQYSYTFDLFDLNCLLRCKSLFQESPSQNVCTVILHQQSRHIFMAGQWPVKVALWQFGVFLTLKFALSICVVFWWPSQGARYADGRREAKGGSFKWDRWKMCFRHCAENRSHHLKLV